MGGALLLGASVRSMECGGISAGDYVIYRVAFDEQDLSSGCYFPNDGPGPNEKSDSSTILDGTTFILYAGPEDTFYLDTGSAILEGTADGDVYSFSGKVVDVNYANADGSGDKFTTTDTLTIDFTVDGSSAFGTVSNTHSETCKASTCPDLPPSCTTSQDFVGTEVDDIELKHDV